MSQKSKNLKAEHGSGVTSVLEEYGTGLTSPLSIRKEKAVANTIKLHQMLLLHLHPLFLLLKPI
jgi:hypothetical protein